MKEEQNSSTEVAGDPEEVTPKMEQKFDIRNYIVSSDKRTFSGMKERLVCKLSS